jgi:hypothetical protein
VNAGNGITVGAALATDTGALALSSAGTIGVNSAMNTAATLAIDADGLTTLAAAGDIISAGAVTFGGVRTGLLSLAGDINTNDASITLSRSVTLTGNVSLDTHAITSAGDIMLSSVTGNGFDLALRTGHVNGADISLASLANVGTLTFGDVGTAVVSGAATLSTAFILQDALISVDFQGALTAPTLSVPATVSAYNFLLSGTGGDIANHVTFSNTGNLVLGHSGGSLTFRNGLTADGNASRTLSGSILTQGASVDIADQLSLAADVVIDTGNGALGTIILGDVLSNGHHLTLDSGMTAGADITMGSMNDLSGGLTLVDAGGSVTFSSLGTVLPGNIVVTQSRAGVVFQGDVYANNVQISDTADGQSVVFEGDAHLAGMTIASEPFGIAFLGLDNTVTNFVDFRNTGILTIGDDFAQRTLFGAGLTATAPSSVRLLGLLETTNAALRLGSVVMTGPVSLHSGSGIVDVNQIDDGVASYLLTLGSLSQTGAFVFRGNVAVDTFATFAAPYSVTLLGALSVFDSAVVFANTGGVILGNSENDSFLFSSGFSSIAGLTTSFARIMTAASPLSIAALSLAGNTTIDTTNNAVLPSGNDITLAAVNGAAALTLNTGSAGNILFAQAVGGLTPLTSLRIVSAANISFQDVTTTGAFIQEAGTGVSTIYGGILAGADVEMTAGEIVLSGQGHINANNKLNNVYLTALTGAITSGDAGRDILANNLVLNSFSGAGTLENPLRLDVTSWQYSHPSTYYESFGDVIFTQPVERDYVELDVYQSLFDDDDSGAYDIVSQEDSLLITRDGVIGDGMNPVEVSVGGRLLVSPGGSFGLLSAVINGETSDRAIHILNSPSGLVLFNNRIWGGPTELMENYTQSLGVPGAHTHDLVGGPDTFGRPLGGPMFFYLNPPDIVRDFQETFGGTKI